MTPQPPKSILSRIKGLNPRQQEAVRYIDGPCLVLAGAGSGKTSVITTKIAYLVQECGMSARRIAAVTFTNKAAREMKERVGQMLKGKEGHGLTVSTFHNLGLNIIRGELKTLGYKPGFSLFDPEDCCEPYLRGVPGEREVTIDRRRRELVGLGERITPATPGGDVVLSLDRTLQQVTEEELARLGEEHEPEGAAVVVVDPRTGDVLAMASWPTFDPRDPGQDFAQGQHNRAIQHGYEPGSTMKPLLVGMAWQLGLGGPQQLIHCPRRYKVPGRRKPVVDSHTVGTVPELEVLVQSSNSGAVQISARLTNEQIRQTLAAFGLGRRTKIPLPAEIPGDTRSLNKMNRAHLAAVAQGYAVMVTPLQMALAYGALANGGTLFAPRLVVEVRDRQGKVLHKNEPRALARPLTSRISHGALREALVQVVNGERGTAKRARSKRYTIAGKTGTTKKIENGRYHEREVVASFAGYAPAENPRLAFAVVAWGPSTKERRAWGGTVAAPAAGRIAERALRLWRVPASPDSEEAKKAAEAKQAESQQARSH